ncbi:MAG: hypothetical protein ABSH51_11735 [Solirubrobacteraceae bacterium]|jgi:hypothetical protein
MDVSQITELPPFASSRAPAVHLAPPASAVDPMETPSDGYLACGECGSATERAQRYCVNCGAHQGHANDPAARYFSQATATSRSARGLAGARRSGRSGGRTYGIGAALVLALIPVTAAVGVEVGRSSNSQDAQLIQALARRQATVTAPASTSPSTTATGAGVPASSTKAGHAKTTKASGKANASTKGAGKVLSTTKNGSVTQITGAKATQAQVQQGAAAAQQVQKSTGKSYVNTQNNLPSTVVVP